MTAIQKMLASLKADYKNATDGYHRIILRQYIKEARRYAIQESKQKGTAAIPELCHRAYATSKAHGWKHDNPGQAIALMHSELSEALEAMRKPDHKDEHLPDLDPVGLELADVLIRVFDFCGARKIDLATCLKAKMDYNDRRPMKHGGKLF